MNTLDDNEYHHLLKRLKMNFYCKTWFNIERLYEIAVKALLDLDRTPDKDGLYRRLQIGINGNHRIYICCSSLFYGNFLIHEEFDCNSKHDNTQALNEKYTISFIKSFDTINFIGTDFNDESIIIYSSGDNTV